MRETHRFKEQEELFGGAPCEGVASQTEACINRICPGMHMCKNVIKILFDIFCPKSVALILKRYLSIPEQCCEANNVPQKCLGLCVGEEDAAVVARSAFRSICDKFRSIVTRCTVEGGGIYCS